MQGDVENCKVCVKEYYKKINRNYIGTCEEKIVCEAG